MHFRLQCHTTNAYLQCHTTNACLHLTSHVRHHDLALTAPRTAQLCQLARGAQRCKRLINSFGEPDTGVHNNVPPRLCSEYIESESKNKRTPVRIQESEYISQKTRIRVHQSESKNENSSVRRHESEDISQNPRMRVHQSEDTNQNSSSQKSCLQLARGKKSLPRLICRQTCLTSHD